MTNTKEDYIFTYNDTNRHGLASGITATILVTAAFICPFMHDITYWLAALGLSMIGGLIGLYGTWQSKFNSKNKFPGKLCKIAAGLNLLCFTAILIMLIIAIIGLCITGGR